jgi:hypothetical protein
VETGLLVREALPYDVVWWSHTSGRRVLVTFDRQMSSYLGRPCAIQDEEYVDLGFGTAFLRGYLTALTLIYLSNAMTSTGKIRIQNKRSSSHLINLRDVLLYQLPQA